MNVDVNFGVPLGLWRGMQARGNGGVPRKMPTRTSAFPGSEMTLGLRRMTAEGDGCAT